MQTKLLLRRLYSLIILKHFIYIMSWNTYLQHDLEHLFTTRFGTLIYNMIWNTYLQHDLEHF